MDTLPSRIRAGTVLMPHQVEGVEWLRKRTSWLLGDDLGLGKSLQALYVAALDFEKGFAHRVLVIATATLKYNWVDEIEKWTTFSYTMLEGSPTQREKILRNYDTDILIINYEQIKVHVDELNEMGFDIIIADEFHLCKNPKSKRTKATLKLLADRYFLMTGSPMLNKVNELWTSLHRVDPSSVPGYYQYCQIFCVYGGYAGKQIIGVKNQKRLKALLDEAMLRRLKVDVLDLPEKQIIQVLVDLLPEQRKVYDEAWKEMRITLPNNPDPMELENAFTKFLRLKQICSTTANIEGMGDHSAKLDRIVEIVEELDEHIVIFTQFRPTLAALVQRLEALPGKMPVFGMTGDTKPNDRVPMVKRWASSPPGVLVCMIQVAGVGLNMTTASKCIFADKLFVPKLNEQGQDRLYRIGADLTQPVQIFEIIARKTMEQRIETILRQKMELFDELIETPLWKREFFKALMEADDDGA